MQTAKPGLRNRIDALPNDHLFRFWNSDKPPWKMVRRMFADLSLENAERKWSEFAALVDTPETSQAAVNKAAWLAELEAFWILTEHLDFQPTGFEVTSPTGTEPGRTCDFGGTWEGQEHFVEVKCRARERTQKVPETVHKTLAELEDLLDLNLRPTLRDGQARFDDARCKRLRRELIAYVEVQRRYCANSGLDSLSIPSYGFENALSILISQRQVNPYPNEWSFDALEPEEVRVWLFGTCANRAGGKVQEALDKGATVLAVRAASIPTLEEIRDACFPEAVQFTLNDYEVDDPRLGNLQYILMITSWDEYELFANGRST